MSTTGSIGVSLILFSVFISFGLSPVERGETESVIDASLRKFLRSHGKIVEDVFFCLAAQLFQRTLTFGLQANGFYVTTKQTENSQKT